MTKELSTKMNAALECSIANTPEAREQVYRLRYACYRRKGSIDVSTDEQFRDSFDAAPNSFSFLVRNGGEAAATVRISVVQHKLGWTDSPVVTSTATTRHFRRSPGDPSSRRAACALGRRRAAIRS
jgi:hypothetical protein